jgi:hypothetical protein
VEIRWGQKTSGQTLSKVDAMLFIDEDVLGDTFGFSKQ